MSNNDNTAGVGAIMGFGLLFGGAIVVDTTSWRVTGSTMLVLGALYVVGAVRSIRETPK